MDRQVSAGLQNFQSLSDPVLQEFKHMRYEDLPEWSARGAKWGGTKGVKYRFGGLGKTLWAALWADR